MSFCRWLAVFALISAALAAGCTTHYRIPKEAQACTDRCAATRGACFDDCGKSRGNMQPLEDLREGLCGKRCGEDYDSCMVACPVEKR